MLYLSQLDISLAYLDIVFVLNLYHICHNCILYLLLLSMGVHSRRAPCLITSEQHSCPGISLETVTAITTLTQLSESKI